MGELTMRLSMSGLLMLGLLAGTASRIHAAESSDPQAVIRKAIDAMGGEEKLARFKGSMSKSKCKFYMMGQVVDGTAQVWSQPPRQLKVIFHLNMGGKPLTRIEVVTKDGGWRSLNGKLTPLTDDEVAKIYEGMEVDQAANLLALKDPGYQITSLGESTVANRPAVGLKVAHAGHQDVLLYFDKERGYLVKMQTRTKTTGSELDEENFYADYQDYSGILNANKVTTKRGGKTYAESETTEFKAVEKISDRVFAKPASASRPRSTATTR
jgi:hypothetical protein